MLQVRDSHEYLVDDGVDRNCRARQLQFDHGVRLSKAVVEVAHDGRRRRLGSG